MTNNDQTCYAYDITDGLRRMSEQEVSAIEALNLDWNPTRMDGAYGDISIMTLSLKRSEQSHFRHRVLVDTYRHLNNEESCSSSEVYITDALSLLTYFQTYCSDTTWGQER